MNNSLLAVHENDQDVGFNVTDEFDGLQTFKEIYDAMPPMGAVDRLIIDFSHVSHAKPIELYALLAEMAAVARFRNIEIRIEGLRFDFPDHLYETAEKEAAF